MVLVEKAERDEAQILGPTPKSMKVDSTTGALTVMAIVALGLIAIRSSASTTAPAAKRNPQPPTPAFSLFVVVTFSSTEAKTKFKALFKPLARYVQDHEPTTLSYILAESDKDPLKTIQILERYQDKENAFLKIHRSSEPFLTFKTKMQAMVESGEITKVDGQSYIEQLGYGFV